MHTLGKIRFNGVEIHNQDISKKTSGQIPRNDVAFIGADRDDGFHQSLNDIILVKLLEFIGLKIKNEVIDGIEQRVKENCLVFFVECTEINQWWLEIKIFPDDTMEIEAGEPAI